MEADVNGIWLKDILVFLVAAGVIVPLFKAARLGAVLGFLIAGVALGPFGLGRFSDAAPVLSFVTVSDPHAIEPFAELGVLFLLFLLGLELSFRRLWTLRLTVFGTGGLQSGLSAVAIGLAAFFLGYAAPSAVIVGLAFALSSTAIVMQILFEERRVATPVGRTALGVLLMQDILVAPILILAGFLARSDDGGLLGALGQAAWQGGAAILIIFVVGRYLLRPAFRLAARFGGRDTLMALTLVAVVGASVLTDAGGLSLALGAFLAGLLVGETEFKHQAEIDLDPFKGLLLGLFFVTVGMGIDLVQVWQSLPVILAGLAAMLVVKFIIVMLASLATGSKLPVALEAAFLLAPAGEFAFVILAAATTSGVVASEAMGILGPIAGLSMLLTPLFARLGRRVAMGMERDVPDTANLPDGLELSGHVIIAGFGRVGRSVARVMEEEGATLVALEKDAKRAETLNKEGWPVYFGDAGRPEMLERVGIDGAALFIVTVDNPEAACAIVKSVRTLRSSLPVIARARDPEHAKALAAAGATHVTLDAIEAALQMAARALEEWGLPPDAIRSLVDSERDDEYARAEKH